MDNITHLASKFRAAIDTAKNAGKFRGDARFCGFPRGCCDDASVLLAQFLLGYGIITHSVNGTYRDDVPENIQPHEWLSANNQIIDITGDQFRFEPIFSNYEIPSVYVGPEDDFHRLFCERLPDRENKGIDALGHNSHQRLWWLYQTITEYI